MRRTEITRNTKETQIKLALNLDGNGEGTRDTGVPFFDHMLDHVAKHGLFDLDVTAKGDYQIDDHHTVEDVGIVLGKALAQALDGSEIEGHTLRVSSVGNGSLILRLE